MHPRKGEELAEREANMISFSRRAFLSLVGLIGLLSIAHSTAAQVNPDIDGTYVFVSESTHTTKPKEQTVVRKSPEWNGIYIFHDGAYSLSLVNKNRNGDWVGFFPKDYSDIGYETEAGNYTILNGFLRLEANIALNPFAYDRSTDWRFKIQGGELVLYSDLIPHVEDLRQGKVTIVLRKVDSRTLKDL